MTAGTRSEVHTAGFDILAAVNAELEPWAPTNEVLEDGATFEGRVLHRSSDGRSVTGILEVTPGTVSGTVLTPEVSVVVSGRMTVIDEADGTVCEMTAGDVAVWRPGAQIRWEVHERIVIVYHSAAEQVPER